MRTIAKNVAEYFSWFPEDTQNAMTDVKKAILDIVPDAGESISYAMPTYKYHGLLAHFAAYEKHIGFYPGSLAIKVFADDLEGYKSAKGSVQFPLERPMPLTLVKKIVVFRLSQNTCPIIEKI